MNVKPYVAFRCFYVT